LLLEFSVKSGKTQHQNPEFVPKKLGEIRAKPAKKYFSIQEGRGGDVKLRKAPFLVYFKPQFHPVLIPSFLSPELLQRCYMYFHCSYLYNYYNYSRTLCSKC
jgi:hypothetical protein